MKIKKLTRVQLEQKIKALEAEVAYEKEMKDRMHTDYITENKFKIAAESKLQAYTDGIKSNKLQEEKYKRMENELAGKDLVIKELRELVKFSILNGNTDDF